MGPGSGEIQGGSHSLAVTTLPYAPQVKALPFVFCAEFQCLECDWHRPGLWFLLNEGRKERNICHGSFPNAHWASVQHHSGRGLGTGP